MNKTGRIITQIGILLGFIGTIVVNTLSSLGILNNKDPGVLSDSWPNLFVPAGITFLVWALIYIGLLALTIYSIRSWFKKDMDPPEVLDKFGIEFIIASIANIGWIFLWHWQAELSSTAYSLGAMVILLVALLVAYLRLKVGRNKEATSGQKWFVHLPFSFYLGWITIATVANVTALLVETGWQDVIAPTDQWKLIWTIIMISIAVVITLLMLLIRNDVGYSVIVIWALTGIILKRYEVAPPVVLEVVITAGVGIGLIAAMSIISLIRILKNRKKVEALALS